MTRVAVLVVVACACSSRLETSRSEDAIIGGTTASTSRFSTVVTLEERAGDWFCTGVLVDPRWVLTAAHCVDGETADNLQVRFDADDVDATAGTTTAQIRAIHVDPAFADDWPHDISVLELSTAVTEGDPTPLHRASLDVGATVTIVGYGDDNPAGGGAGILRALDTQTADCAMVGDPLVSNATNLCFDASGGTATCHGDSGGPAFVAVEGGLEVAAVTSGGTGNGCGEGWDLDTSVAAELAFVDRYVPGPGGGGCNAGGASWGGVSILALALRFRRRRR